MRKLILVVLRVAYFVSWFFMTGSIAFIAASFIWVFMGLGKITGMDGDIVLLSTPLGVVAGFFLARHSLRNTILHILLLVFGSLIAIGGGIYAKQLFLESQEATGVYGPFSGLGEALGGFAFIFVSVLGVVMSIGGLAGWLGRKISTRSLLAVFMMLAFACPIEAEAGERYRITGDFNGDGMELIGDGSIF